MDVVPSSRAVLRTLNHLSEHALLVFGPPFTQDFSRSWEAAFQTGALNVTESPASALCSIRKLISLISFFSDQSHLGLLPVAGSTMVVSPSSDCAGLLGYASGWWWQVCSGVVHVGNLNSDHNLPCWKVLIGAYDLMENFYFVAEWGCPKWTGVVCFRHGGGAGYNKGSSFADWTHWA